MMKISIANLYTYILNILHFPLIKKGAEDPVHNVFKEFLSLTQEKESSSLLEIGSRNVSGITRKGWFPHCENYTGFDVLSGEGVDVVGDAHKLSEYFPNESFDFVFSISVFEHLLSPWKVVLEMNKVMKTGGYAFISTHPAWPPHELPWDFWRFPQNGFYSLFNQYTGFVIILLKEGLPGKVYSLVDDKPTRNNCFNDVSQSVSIIVKKVANYREDLLKWDIPTESVVDTMYPQKAK